MVRCVAAPAAAPFIGSMSEKNISASEKIAAAEDLLMAARRGNRAAFAEILQPIRRELRAFTYRMLGSCQDAEDALQETSLKAWHALANYQEQSSFRAWMYRIATPVCLELLRTKPKRMVPREVGPAGQPGPPSGEPRSDIAWLDPFPDSFLPPEADPARALQLRQSVRLGLVRAMQVLPPKQRAALILHDVLDWNAAEVAAMVEITEVAVNSALVRGRATLAELGEATDAVTPEAGARLETQAAAAAAELVRAWERGDFTALTALLTSQVTLSMPPWAYWLDGRKAVSAAFTDAGTWQGAPRPGRYRMVATAMNGQPAALAYVLDEASGRHALACLTALGLDGDGRIAELSVYAQPAQLTAWGFPPQLA